jgi:hypothetical protein
MIRLSCPGCSASLEFSDDLAGSATCCYACRSPVKVPAVGNSVQKSAQPPVDDPLSERWRETESLASPRSFSMPNAGSSNLKAYLSLGIMAVVIIAGIVAAFLANDLLGNLSTGGHVLICVDNGGAKPMVVSVDGKEITTVEPGTFKSFQCEPGSRLIGVRSEGEVIFEGVKELEKPADTSTNRRYVFNPDNRNRYRTYTVTYARKGVEPYQSVNSNLGIHSRQRQIRTACEELVGAANLRPAEPWFEIERIAYLLTKPLRTKFEKYRDTIEEQVLTRIDPKDYAVIAATKDNREPTEDDLNALVAVMGRVFDSER